MRLRLKLRGLGKRLLATLVRHQRPRDLDHEDGCRVCFAEQTVRPDDDKVCASHLLSRLDSLMQPVVANPLEAAEVSQSASPVPNSPVFSRTASARSSTINILPTYCACADSNVCAAGYCWCDIDCACTCDCTDGDGTPRWVTRTNKPAQAPPPHNNLLLALQATLGNLRYAVSGHLAIQLLASRYSDTRGPLSSLNGLDLSPEERASAACQPSIVCPRSTRDILPSWAAASRGRFAFAFELDYDTMQVEPRALRIVVDGRPVSVRIDWVDDDQFNTYSPYLLHEDVLNDTLSFPASAHACMPVLSVPSLLQLGALSYANSATQQATSTERRAMGLHITLCLELMLAWRLPLWEHEVSALYDAAFYEPFCLEFTDAGAAMLRRLVGSPSSRSTLCSSPTSIRSGTSGSCSPRHKIRRKPLPPGSRFKELPTLPST